MAPIPPITADNASATMPIFLKINKTPLYKIWSPLANGNTAAIAARGTPELGGAAAESTSHHPTGLDQTTRVVIIGVVLLLFLAALAVLLGRMMRGAASSGGDGDDDDYYATTTTTPTCRPAGTPWGHGAIDWSGLRPARRQRRSEEGLPYFQHVEHSPLPVTGGRSTGGAVARPTPAVTRQAQAQPPPPPYQSPPEHKS